MGDMGELGLWAAFVAGLAASGHCASMCGGIAGAFAMRTQRSGSGSKLAMGLSVLGFSVPTFWIGLVLILTFAVNLGWLPAGGRISTSGPKPTPRLRNKPNRWAPANCSSR